MVAYIVDALFNALSAKTRRRQQRRYQSAHTILLARLTYESLGRMDRQRVTESVRRYLIRNAAGLDPSEIVDWTAPAAKDALRAIAMEQLCIRPHIDGESWELPKKRFWQFFDGRATELMLNYHPSDVATERARADLERK